MFKIDKNLDILKSKIDFCCYLIQDLILISSKSSKFSLIYSTNKLNSMYEIDDYIEIAFNLGLDKFILIGKKVKQIVSYPDMQILPLNDYETDIFSSFEEKTFYPINNNTFYYINHKNRKLKEIMLNEYKELIVKKEKISPLDFVKFCPFKLEGNDGDIFICGLFICKDQIYYIINENFEDLLIEDNSPNYHSSIKRLFISIFEQTFNELVTFENLVNNKNELIQKETKNTILQYIQYSNSGDSKLNLALMKNNSLTELDGSCCFLDKKIISQVITNGTNKEIYIFSIIKNSYIYITKIAGDIIKEKKENFIFEKNIKTIGILNLDKYLAFVYYDKKAKIINVSDSFENKINPVDTFLFPIELIYAYKSDRGIILLTVDKAFLFDHISKKIIKEMRVEIDLSYQKNDINILRLENDVYIIINELNFMLFDIDIFQPIRNIQEYNLINNNFLFFSKYPDKFEVNKINLFNYQVVQNYKVNIPYRDRIEFVYLNDGRLFVGVYPNTFYIFENN